VFRDAGGSGKGKGGWMSNENDRLFEKAALEVERFDLDEVMGLMARRKRAREDSLLRSRTIRETRAKCAAEIRALKSNRRSDPVQILERVKEAGTERHEFILTEAWPLVWDGLLDVECTIKCNSNSIPPQTRFRIVLTEKGQAMLDREAAQGAARPSITRS
jgi:hypothetical protein